MSNQSWLEWLHGEQWVNVDLEKGRVSPSPKPKEPDKPVTEVEVFEDTTSPNTSRKEQE